MRGKSTANQLIPLLLNFVSLQPLMGRSTLFISLLQALLPTSLHRALMIWAACQGFHSFYKHIKNTLQPLLQICPCTPLCHICLSALLNFLSIPLLPLNLTTQFTSAVASQGSYCQVLYVPCEADHRPATPPRHTQPPPLPSAIPPPSLHCIVPNIYVLVFKVVIDFL